MQIIENSPRKYRLPSDSERALAKQRMDKLRKEGDKMVKGIFEFVDAGGGWLDFSYRFWPGEPVRTVKITHGEVIDIPLILARHLNNVYKKVRVPRSNLDQGADVITRTSRCRFTPVDMLDPELIKAS